MKVLGVSGGMKNGSNDSLCKEALMGAKEAGAEIEFIRLLDLEIKPCTGCISCVMSMMSGKGNACVIKDDLQWLQDKMLDADGIIFVAPIFEKGTTGLVRTIMDRFGPRSDRGNCIISNKIAQATGGKLIDPRLLQDRVISFMGIGGSDWATRIECDHGMLALTPMWKVIENVCFSWSKHIIVQDEKIAQAHQLGRTLAEAAADIPNASYKGKPGMCPHCHSKEFYITPGTNEATCCLCGIEGNLVSEGDKLVFKYDEKKWASLAHDTLPGKFKHGDDIKDMEGKLQEIKKTDKYKERTQKYKSFIEPVKPR